MGNNSERDDDTRSKGGKSETFEGGVKKKGRFINTPNKRSLIIVE